MTDKTIMPTKLTAENGAKAALMGEFSVPLPEYCVYCSGQGCGACKGKGEVIRRIHVPWTTIKEVYAKASVQEYIEDGNEIPEKCIARLTPGAREWVCGIIEDVWRNEEDRR